MFQIERENDVPHIVNMPNRVKVHIPVLKKLRKCCVKDRKALLAQGGKPLTVVPARMRYKYPERKCTFNTTPVKKTSTTQTEDKRPE